MQAPNDGEIATLLGLWYENVSVRKELDYGVSVEVMFTIMKGVFR
tara:strand:- start:302 stop:436 length:135 start_codon:yes stop_codon:yes gene_type:complete